MRHLLCLLFLIPNLALAQSNGSRTCRILFLGAPDDAPEKLQLFDGTASQEVELPRMNLSKVYPLPAGALVIRMLTTAPAKPEEASPDAPKAAIAESLGDFYLLVSSDPSNKIAPVKLQVIDADPAKFKNGQMLWFNLTANSVGGQVGTQKLAMTANSRTILDAPASKSEDFNVNLSFRIPGDERLHPLCETKWQHDSRSRTVLFVINQGGSRVPRILGFPDYREPAEKKP
ncbi:MAG: hypothetical protein V4689_20800 [Verrucomicrobiota bacterium]